jgi:hypothetical protein
MKSIQFASIALIALTTAASALATTPRQTLVKMRTSGGLFPMPARTLVVTADGAVIRHEADFVEQIASLSANSVERLREGIASARDGQLRDTQPQDPMCMDAPVTSFIAVNDQQQEVVVARISGCKLYINDNAGAAYSVRTLLEGLNVLTY